MGWSVFERAQLRQCSCCPHPSERDNTPPCLATGVQDVFTSPHTSAPCPHSPYLPRSHSISPHPRRISHFLISVSAMCCTSKVNFTWSGVFDDNFRHIWHVFQWLSGGWNRKFDLSGFGQKNVPGNSANYVLGVENISRYTQLGSKPWKSCIVTIMDLLVQILQKIGTAVIFCDTSFGGSKRSKLLSVLLQLIAHIFLFSMLPVWEGLWTKGSKEFWKLFSCGDCSYSYGLTSHFLCVWGVGVGGWVFVWCVCVRACVRLCLLLFQYPTDKGRSASSSAKHYK